MAADDKGTGQESPLHVAPSASNAERSAQTEWTASDRRGPLGSADGDDVERVVPAHEIDAEGSIDGGTPPETPASTAPAVGGEGSERGASAGTAATTPTPAEPKRSLVPVAAGLVIGALVGAGSAWLVYAGTGGTAGVDKQVAALSARVDALDKRPDAGPELASLKVAVTDVQGKVAALEKSGANQPAAGGGDAPEKAASSATSDPALGAKVAALQATIDGLRKRDAAAPAEAGDGGAAAKVASLQTAVDAARKQAGDAAAALDAFKNEQRQYGAKLAALSTTVAGTLAKAEGAEKQAADAQSGLQAVQGRQTTLEGKLGSPALAVVADSLVEQIRAGQPFERQVDALAALGVDPAVVALLREKSGGVASAQSLLAEWKPLENAVIATGNKAPADAGFGQRLEHGLFGLVSVRRADGTIGNDLAARAAVIGDALTHGDVTGAAAAWQALPADAKARSDAWGAKLGASATTLAKARDLQRTAIDALGKKS